MVTRLALLALLIALVVSPALAAPPVGDAAPAGDAGPDASGAMPDSSGAMPGPGGGVVGAGGGIVNASDVIPGALGAAGSGGGPVYGAAVVPLRFAHAQHAAVPCATCHAAASTSARVGDRLLPAEAVCFGCHDPRASAEPAAQCAMCHPGYRPAWLPADPRETHLARPWPAAVEWPVAGLVFGHRPHLARGASCSDCHAGVEASSAAGERFVPSMAACVACHADKGASTRCATCHPAGPDGTLVTALAAGALVPRGAVGTGADHGGDFAVRHGTAARADADGCATCHSPPSCERCHVDQVRPVVIHPFDWVRLHGIEAKRSVDGCGSCHRAQSFCVDCHVRSGVSIAPGPVSFGAVDGTARFHPAGFVGSAFEAPGSGHHGVAARRNLRECVSCHRESECVTCHGAGAPVGLRAGSPHPPGFGCGSLAQARRGCEKCHSDRAALDRLCGR